MSMTDLKALALSCEIGARKLPAAPQLRRCTSQYPLFFSLSSWVSAGVFPVCRQSFERERTSSHEEVNGAELLDAGVDRFLQALWAADVHGADADHFGPFPRRHDVLRHALGLGDVAADDAGVGAEVDHGADLGAADGAVAASAEDDFVGWGEKERVLVSQLEARESEVGRWGGL